MPTDLFRYFAALLVTIIVSASSIDAHGQVGRPTRVGIVVVLSVNVDDTTTNSLVQTFDAALRESFSIEVLSGNEVERRLPSAGLPEDCVGDAECRSNIGRRLQADELLFVVITGLGDETYIDTTWANIASGDSASMPRLELAGGDDVKAKMVELAPRILPHIAERERLAREAKARQDNTKSEPRPIVIVPREKKVVTRPVPMATWIAGGIGVATLAGGTVFALSAQRKYDSLRDDECDIQMCANSRISTLRSHSLTADILFGATAVAATTALVFYLRREEVIERRESDLEVQPTAGADNLGVVLRGRF